jgi:hypothetical protein
MDADVVEIGGDFAQRQADFSRKSMMTTFRGLARDGAGGI